MLRIDIPCNDGMEILADLVHQNFLDDRNMISIGLVKMDAMNTPITVEIEEKNRDQVVEFLSRLQLLLAMPEMIKAVPDEVFESMYIISKEDLINAMTKGMEQMKEFAQDLEIQLAISKP